MGYIRRVAAMLLCALMLLGALPVLSVRAEETQARKLPGLSMVTSHRGDHPANWLFDGNTVKGFALTSGYHLTLAHDEGIGYLYLIFDIEYGPYRLINNDTGEEFTAGQNGYLHELLDLTEIFGQTPRSVTLRFENGTLRLNELTAYSAGELPDKVQRWEEPAEGGADLVLFSAHGDDEQIFFAGLLPYYAGELGYQVQVVYLTNHRNVDNQRCHEMLNGLWAVGVRSYPVFGTFGDYLSTTKDKAYSSFAYMGVTKDMLLDFVVEQVRRFRPRVAVGHDPINGEYGHGAHFLYAELLCEAAELASDPESFPESAEAYGLWDVPKVYLHLYPENPIVMDWDQPLERFGGKTAFEVTRDIGFAYHWSQQIAFGSYITPYDNALEMPYSPAYYGLYRSTVGLDVQGGDMFENLLTYDQEAYYVQMHADALEQLQQEEAALAESQAAEEAAAAEEETIALETQKQQSLTEESVHEGKIVFLPILAGLVLSLTGIIWVFILVRRRNSASKK